MDWLDVLEVVGVTLEEDVGVPPQAVTPKVNKRAAATAALFSFFMIFLLSEDELFD
jgi:hypothetical protein